MPNDTKSASEAFLSLEFLPMINHEVIIVTSWINIENHKAHIRSGSA